jgi:hypothetical protein
LYTSDQWGKAAASEDLQRAFDAADTGSVNTGSPGTGKKDGASGRRNNRKSGAKNSAKPLDNLFDLWVYGISNTTPR